MIYILRFKFFTTIKQCRLVLCLPGVLPGVGSRETPPPPLEYTRYYEAFKRAFLSLWNPFFKNYGYAADACFFWGCCCCLLYIICMFYILYFYKWYSFSSTNVLMVLAISILLLNLWMKHRPKAYAKCFFYLLVTFFMAWVK